MARAWLTCSECGKKYLAAVGPGAKDYGMCVPCMEGEMDLANRGSPPDSFAELNRREGER